jgi:N-acetylmuramic acid 6-phosphate (MurNAc-6-P) etherase
MQNNGKLIQTAATLINQADQVEDATAKAALNDAARVVLQNIIDSMQGIQYASDTAEDDD